MHMKMFLLNFGVHMRNAKTQKMFGYV